MIIKVEIDLEDMLGDMIHNESGEIAEEIKGQIINGIMKKVLPTMQASIDKMVDERINPVIVARVERAVDIKLAEVMDKGLIRVNGQSPIKIEKHIQNLFESNRGWGNPADRIEKVAKAFGQDLKTQYNNVFAMNIVANMKDQGLLKDDVAEMLTAPSAPS
jgi:hypothetical protein